MHSSSGEWLAWIENSCCLDNKQRVDTWQEHAEEPILKGETRNFTTNTENGAVYAGDSRALYTCDLWKREEQKEGYA